ncbi:MAG: hypothetical protein ACOVNY_00205 [Chitinophagaceae bacterium]
MPRFIFFACILFTQISAIAQTPVKVAVFVPLYVDSAFTNNTYKLGNTTLPKYMLSGLEFYNGVQLAIDSLKAEGKSIEVLIYDSKSSNSIESICNQPAFENVSLMIAQFNNRSEVKPLADIAFKKQIPLISATFPNDGGVTDNPFFVLLNTGLKTHIDEIYKYAQKYYATSNIIYIRKKGALENMLFSYFNSATKNTAAIPLKYKIIELNDGFTQDQITAVIDSNRKNTLICGSLDESFGLQLVKTLSGLKSYQSTVIGMPTWDNIKELDRSDIKAVTTIYTTSFWYRNIAPLYNYIQKKYKQKLFVKPSEWVLKGFECMYHFGSIAITNPTDCINHLSDKKFTCFNDFNIQPIKNSTAPTTIKYLENQQLYFIKKLDGLVIQ